MINFQNTFLDLFQDKHLPDTRTKDSLQVHPIDRVLAKMLGIFIFSLLRSTELYSLRSSIADF
jgi:hypothetical protein